MSGCGRNPDDVKALLQSCEGFDSQQTMKFYDTWAEMYEQDLTTMNYRSPHLGVDFLNNNFSGSREEVQVLDVACGSGWVAKLMAELGFRHFVGVDCSQGMLELAAKTGLYQDLRRALLGTEPLPAQSDAFDVVILTGALDAGFVPVSVVRELCQATKPGGLVCISKGDHTGAPAAEYQRDLERELQLMEDEGLWTQVGLKKTDKYMENPYLNTEGATDRQYISGRVLLYKKCIH